MFDDGDEYDDIRRWYEDEVADNERTTEQLIAEVAALHRSRRLLRNRRYVTALRAVEDAAANLWRESNWDNSWEVPYGSERYFDHDRLKQARAALAQLRALLTNVRVVFTTTVADLTVRSALHHHDTPADDGRPPGRIIAASPHLTHGPPAPVEAPSSAGRLVAAV